MPSHVLSDVLKTVGFGLSLWILPWVVVFSTAALWSFVERRFAKHEPPPIHLSPSVYLRKVEPPKAA